MSVVPIRLFGDPVLRQRAEPVDTVDHNLRRWMEDLIHTLDAAEGLGLAAPQIGVLRRLFVVNLPALDLGEEPQVLINPEIVAKEGWDVAEEGCLSIPGLYAPVGRYTRIRVRAQILEGDTLKSVTFTAEDLYARVIQHEYDHLNGVLFIDHLPLRERARLLAQWKGLSTPSPGTSSD
ncbi:MAG: peptide deformylase [Candidatus Hydrothermae bacterium]|nr:peptide deformylase [Candidatus Hydrothermae bacterium]